MHLEFCSVPEVMSVISKDSGKIVCSEESVFGTTTTKMIHSSPSVIGAKVNICDGIEAHQCPQHGGLAFVEMAIDTKVYCVLGRQICCYQSNVFTWKVSGGFILHVLQQSGNSDRLHVFDWPACSSDLSPTENVWCIMQRRIKYN